MKKFEATDLLFAVQLVGMVFFTGGQFVRMTHSVQGISPVWLACAWAFCVINVGIAYRGWRENKVRSTLLLLVMYVGWLIAMLPLFVLLCHERSQIVWGWYDTMTAALVVTGTIITLFVGQKNDRSIHDPMVRGTLGAIFRGIPHLFMAYKFWLLGAGGLAAVTVWTAHTTTIVRIFHLASIVRKNGWAPAQRGGALAEGVNELTWIIVTIVWLLR